MESLLLLTYLLTYSGDRHGQSRSSLWGGRPTARNVPLLRPGDSIRITQAVSDSL